MPWLRFASAMVTVANSHYNKKKGCLEWFVSIQPFVFYRIKAMLASCLWQALVFLVVDVDRIVDGVMKTATFIALDSLTGDEITKPHVGFHIKA